MSFRLGEVHRRVPHLVADLVELLLAVGYQGNTRLHHSDVSSILSSANTSSEELDLEDGSNSSDANYREVALEDTWESLEYREKRLGTAYPFQVYGDFIEIQPNLNEEQRVYLFLLACSRLKSFDRPLRSVWATSFSELCAIAMQALMPDSADIKVFDANSTDRQNYYGTDLRTALIKLGEDLSAHHISTETCNKQAPSGDAQLDLVGIVPYDDAARGVLAIFGQCAAREKDWPSKRMEAHPANLSAFFTLLPTPANVCFIPVCYRSSTGEWVNEAKTTGCLLIDRIRILSSLLTIDACSEVVSKDWFVAFEQDLPRNIAA